MRRARQCWIVIAAVLTAACASDESTEPLPSAPPDYDEVVAALQDCPEGDGPWRGAIRVAEGASRAAELTAIARELTERCEDRWEPPWTVGRSLEGQSPDPGDVRAAFEEALRRAIALDDAVGLARSRNQLGWGAYTRGELRVAAATYRVALADAARAERLDLESFIRNNLAGALVELGEFDEARSELEAASRGLTELGRESAAQGLAYNRAVITLELGDANGALGLLRDVHAFAVEHEDVWTVDASAVVAGNVELGMQRTTEARDWYAKIGGRVENLALLGEVGTARAALQEGDAATARRLLASVAERAGPTDTLFGAVTQAILAEAELADGDGDAARRRLSGLLEDDERTLAADAEWIAWWLYGRTLEQAGDADPALAAFERSVAALEQQGGALDPLSDGLYFLRHRADPYASLAVALARDGSDAAHDRLVSVLRTAHARALRRDPGPGGADLGSIRSSLEPDEAIVVYLLGEEAGVALTIRRDAVRALPVAGRARLAASLGGFAASLRAPEADPERLAVDGRRITDELVAPLAGTLRSVERLYVVPDRELALVPFSALPAIAPDGTATLGERFEIAAMPSVGVPPRWSRAPSPVLLAGLPEDSGAPPLPWAGFELSRLQEVWGESRTTATGESFSLDRFVELPLDTFGTIHLATHAEASTVDPRRCGVTMSGGERLGIDRIATLPLDGALVVLSACSTGEGELVPGQGALSLGWAVMVAGARGVVASQWRVDDNAAARLMVRFHEGLRDGVDPVRALAAARRELAASGAPPAHWAPFVIVLRAS